MPLSRVQSPFNNPYRSSLLDRSHHFATMERYILCFTHVHKGSVGRMDRNYGCTASAVVEESPCTEPLALTYTLTSIHKRNTHISTSPPTSTSFPEDTTTHTAAIFFNFHLQWGIGSRGTFTRHHKPNLNPCAKSVL